LTATHVLLLVALVEVAIHRIAAPMLRSSGPPPEWLTYLDPIGQYSFYFTGTLAALLLAVWGWQELRGEAGWRARGTALIVVITTVLAAVPLVIDAPPALGLALDGAFAASVIAIVVAAFGRGRDLGIQVGLPILAIPVLLHVVNAIGARFVWPDDPFIGPGAMLTRAGVSALCLAAVASLYCFAPRPFTRAVLRPGVLLVALGVVGVGAVLARLAYGPLAQAATLAFGVEPTSAQVDPRVTVYLLAVATVVWALASCVGAPSAARRSVGVGLALITLGGYAVKGPDHDLLLLLGLALIGTAARSVRDEELAASPLASDIPPVGDAAWSAYIALLTRGLGRALGDVHSLTTRGEGGLSSSVIVGDAGGRAVRVRIERIDGAVLALDAVVGREIDEVRGATLTTWAIPPRALGINPAGPPAAPIFRTGDLQFDERFRTRGSALAFRKLFDDGLRARAVATLDGWLAYWEDEGLRYRIYPGRGAPLDHPMPLSDLALGRATATAERLITVIELLIELGSRGIPPRPAGESPSEPSELA
jgi:hypothetical protein